MVWLECNESRKSRYCLMPCSRRRETLRVSFPVGNLWGLLAN